jgi:hypothetical protein
VKIPARETLEIVWNGEFVPGLIFYGLFGRGKSVNVDFPDEVWPQPVEVHRHLLHNHSWEVALWEIPMLFWPSNGEWFALVRTTLGRIIDGGARVAWIDSEGNPFADPPDLFDPAHMSGAVLAALTAKGDFWCPLDPDEPLASLTDEQLLQLRQASDGLSNAH